MIDASQQRKSYKIVGGHVCSCLYFITIRVPILFVIIVRSLIRATCVAVFFRLAVSACAAVVATADCSLYTAFVLTLLFVVLQRLEVLTDRNDFLLFFGFWDDGWYQTNQGTAYPILQLAVFGTTPVNCCLRRGYNRQSRHLEIQQYWTKTKKWHQRKSDILPFLDFLFHGMVSNETRYIHTYAHTRNSRTSTTCCILPRSLLTTIMHRPLAGR